MTSTPPLTVTQDAAAVAAEASLAAATVPPLSAVDESSFGPFSGCAMLRFLRRDFGSQCALLSLLLTPDIAMLVRSCKTWGRWVHEPIALSTRYCMVKPSRFAQYLACEWIRPCVHWLDLLLETEPLIIDQDGDAEMAARQAQETQQLEFALAHLGPAFFSRLEHLEVRLRVPRLSDSVLRDCFVSLAPRLQTLSLLFKVPFAKPAIPGDTTLHSLMVHVSLLRRLRSLFIAGPLAEPQSVSFASLPALPQLDRFIFRVCTEDENDAVIWHPSHDQVECLARCDLLTGLECGAWHEDEADPNLNPMRSRMQILSEGKRPRTDATASSSHRTLQSLCLADTVISASVWSHLAHLTELDELWPLGWSWNPSAEEWSLLASFSRLTALDIGPPRVLDKAPELLSTNYFPALVQCSKLVELGLAFTNLSSAQMQLLTRSLPKLRSLQLIVVRLPLESLACLASLPQLTEARLQCAPLEGAFASVRSYLPALLSLTQLCVDEAEEHRFTAAAVSDENDALLARCPKLRACAFKQNLL